MKRDEKYVKVRHRVVVFECKDVLFELATVKSGSLESMRERGGVDPLNLQKLRVHHRNLGIDSSWRKTLVFESEIEEEEERRRRRAFQHLVGSLELLID